MNVEIRETAKRIVSIPDDFNQTDKSARVLLLESGYFQFPDKITVEMLVDTLKDSPTHLDLWFSWSENKRTDSGWFFKINESDICTVGFYPDSSGIAPKIYTDVYLAAANFIKSEIEDIRSSTTC